MTTKSTFTIGNTVQIIDREEDPSEWATFVIAEKEIIQVIVTEEHLSNGASFPKENEYQYLLKPLDKVAFEPLWVVPEEIRPLVSY